MGTNYYVKEEIQEECPVCHHREVTNEIHIGKSSAGWCFALHAIPELGLNNWHNWLVFLQDKKIKDEYGNDISLKEFKSIVLDRAYSARSWVAYNSWEKFHQFNRSIQGPNGLIRSADNVGNGGHEPWDMIEGEFI
jgi:hypothetical protein